MTKYKVYGNRISIVEVESETESTVRIKTSTGKTYIHRKHGFYQEYFDSLNEAKDYLMKKLSGEIHIIENELESLKDDMEIISLLSESDLKGTK